MKRRLLAVLAALVAILGVIAIYLRSRPEDPFRVAGRNGRQPRYFEVGALPVT